MKSRITSKSECYFQCPGCFKEFVGKTDRNFIPRFDEHNTKVD